MGVVHGVTRCDDGSTLRRRLVVVGGTMTRERFFRDKLGWMSGS